MILRFSVFLLLASSILITGCATSPMLWKASDISRRSETYIRLTHNNETLATVETSTIRKLVETKERIERAAGVGYAELVIATGDEPNAFAGNHPKFGRVVGINTGMLKLIGTDWDGYAAIIGHEYAHHALNHGATRTEREAVRQGVATVVGIALGAAGVPMGGTIADVGTMVVTTVYSRDEEREADRKGFEYMVQAGLDPQGAVRVWEKMNAAGTGALIPFLSTHPMSSERVNNMRLLIVAHQTTQVSIGIPQFRKATDADEQLSGQRPLPPCPGSYNAATWTNCVGELTYPSGRKYVGEFKNGKYHGQGTDMSPDGTRYVGEWKDSSRNGQGIEYRPDGSILQSGIWERGVFVNVRETPVIVSPTASAREQADIAQRPSSDLEKRFAAAREANDRKPENNAVAVAKGSTRWVWGTSWSAGTENRARELALDYCKKQASKEGITDSCRVYSVNGRVVYQDAQ